MKCPNCDNAIKPDDIYCGNCGKKIKKESKFLNEIEKNRKTILILLISLLILTSLISVLNYFCSPVYEAEKYFNYLKDNNTSKIYEYIASDSSFTTEEILKKKMSSIKGATNIQIINKYISNDEALITFSYELNNEINIANVSLSKSGHKYLIFNNWKVNSGKVSKNITLKLPNNSKATIDGIDISSYLTDDGEDLDTYKIPSMITGKYKLKVELQDGNVIEKEFETANDVTFMINSTTLSDENKKILDDKSTELINSIYSGLINDVDYNSINYNDSVKKIYKDLRYNYKRFEISLTEFNLSSMDLISSNYNDNGNLELTYEIEYDYKATYQGTSYSSTNRGTITIEYNYKDGYQVKDIGRISINFPIRK